MKSFKSKVYKIRLQREYERAMEMNQSAGGLFKFTPASGEEIPYVEKYIVTFNFPTWVKKGTEIYRQSSTNVIIQIYDINEPLIARIPSGDPIPYHPNWWPSGMICNGQPDREELKELVSYTEFVFEVLQFKEERINTRSSANEGASNYWTQNRNNRSMFPTDTHVFPMLKKRQEIKIIAMK